MNKTFLYKTFLTLLLSMTSFAGWAAITSSFTSNDADNIITGGQTITFTGSYTLSFGWQRDYAYMDIYDENGNNILYANAYASPTSYTIPPNLPFGDYSIVYDIVAGTDEVNSQHYYHTIFFQIINPCALIPGSVVASTESGCGPYISNLSLSGNSGANGYQWQYYTDGAYDWVDIANATNASYEATVSTSASYRAKVLCDATEDFATPIALTYNALPAEPDATIAAPTAVCYNQPAQYNVIINNGIDPNNLSYAWSRTDATRQPITSNSNVANINDISNNAVEDISVTVTHTIDGCSVSATVTAEDQLAVPTPNPSVTASGTKNLCIGQNVVLTNVPNANNNYAFSWKNANNDLVGIEFQYTADQTGTYTLSVTDPLTGCVRTSTPQVVLVKPTPVLNTAAYGTLDLCPSTSVLLESDIQEPGVTYRWKRDGVTNVSTTSSYTAKTAGVYSLTATRNGCTATSPSYNVTVKAAPNVAVTANGSTAFCAGNSVLLSAANVEGYAYQWYNGVYALLGQNASDYTATTAGSYKVAISNGGCPAKSSVVTKVTATTLPAATITQTAASASSVTLRGNNGTVYGYQWYLNSFAILGANSQYYTATENGTYTLELSRNGCTVMSSPKVIGSITTPAGFKMAEEVAQSAISVYPNPSEGIFNIASENAVNVIVRDVQGRVIVNLTNAAQVDLTNQAAGIYLMQIMDAKGNLLQSERLMKK